MADLRFNEESYTRSPEETHPFLIDFVLKLGLAKDARGASIVLGSFAFLLAALAIWTVLQGDLTKDATSGSELLRAAQSPQKLP
jgi:hypothetical protein